MSQIPGIQICGECGSTSQTNDQQQAGHKQARAPVLASGSRSCPGPTLSLHSFAELDSPRLHRPSRPLQTQGEALRAIIFKHVGTLI